VFPFITDMITSFNVPHDKIGLYVGLGEGCLMVVEALAAPVWAKLADRYGRRPAFIGGFTFCIFPAVLVGFSTRPWQVMLWRGLCEWD
jgi:MFS family permease